MANIYELISDPIFARNLRRELVTLYTELKNPLQAEKNSLAADYLNIKMGLEPGSIYKLVSKVQKGTDELDKISQKERQDIANLKSTDYAGKQAIQKRAAQERAEYAKTIPVEDLLKEVINLQAKLENPKNLQSAGVSKEMVATQVKKLNAEIESIKNVLKASERGWGPRTEKERALTAENQRAYLDNLNNLPIAKEFSKRSKAVLDALNNPKDFIKSSVTREYNDLINYLSNLGAIDYTLFPEVDIGRGITSKLSTTYNSLLEAYENFRNSPDFEKLSTTSKITILKNMKALTNNIARVMHESAAIEEYKNIESFSGKGKTAYQDLTKKNANANIVDPTVLEKTETSIGEDKQKIEALLENITSDKNAPSTLDTLATSLDKKVEDLLIKISQADPSERSLESLNRLANALDNLSNQVVAVYQTSALSQEAKIALLKTYLELDGRFKLISSQIIRDKSALSTLIPTLEGGVALVQLPQVVRANVKQLQTKPTIEAPQQTFDRKTGKPTQNPIRQNATMTLQNADNLWSEGNSIKAITAGTPANKYLAGVRDANIKAPETNEWIKLTAEALLEKASPKQGDTNQPTEGTGYGD